MRLPACLFVCAFVISSGVAAAANRTVCSSGCQYTSVQAAIDAAAPGDTILLRAGQTFTENIILRNKNTTSTQYITIRSDASDSSLPAAGVRLIPEGKPGANTRRSLLARLLGRGGTLKSTAVVRAENGAHHYRLQFLEIDGTANLGYETLVMFGSSSSTSLSDLPYALVIDRVWLHGHATLGMKRGVYLNSRSTDVLNSYFDDFFTFGDSQAILGTNGPGPYRIVNNYLQAAGENIMFGGGDPKITNLVPSDIQIRGNYLTKNLRWRSPILATPGRPSVSASSTSGRLSSGTHYFKVVAVISPGGATGYSAPSAEASVSVSSGRSVSLSWGPVSGATKYRVYRGTSSNGQSYYMETSGTQTSFTYTGSGETSGTPRSSASYWTVKNLLELKNAQRVSIDGNILEYSWKAGQQGHAVLFTPNQSGSAPWTIVRDVSFTNNTVRHVAAGFLINGRDYEDPAGQTVNLTIRNNLFYDVQSTWGNTGRWLVITEGPSNVTIDHNTVDHGGQLVEFDGPPIRNFVFTNNMARHNTYGVIGRSYPAGTASLEVYTPGYVFRGNVLAGGDSRQYPSGNYFPSASEFPSQFVSISSRDYRLASSSPYRGRATDGKDIGIDVPALVAAQQAGTAGGGTTDPPPPPPPADDPPTTGTLPSGWLTRDVGAVGTPGMGSGTGAAFTVSGAGADVWGTADAFHYTYRSLTGDGTITAQVSTITGSQAWTKVGVMIRSSTAANAAHAYMLVSTSKGLAFQRRTRDGGTSAHTSGGSGTAPRWVRLTRRGSVVTAYVSTSGTSWTTVGSATMTLPSTALVGLAVSSHDTSRLATGSFDFVSVVAGSTTDTGGTPAPGTLPSGWTGRDVGAVGTPGAASGTGSSFTVSGAGADVWDRADAFHYAYRPLAGDGTITAQVSSITGAEAWTKVGVMIRASTSANAAHAYMLVSTSKGLAFQRRTSDGALSAHTSAGSGTAPRWVRLTRRGNVVTAYASTTGTSWTTVGSATIALPSTALVGLAVSSHDTSRLATGSFDDVSIVSGTSADGGGTGSGTLPSGWLARDVGATGLSGSASGSGSSFVVNGAGDDVWDRADALHFAYTPVSGDAVITAQVSSLTGAEAWTKVGVMIRASTASNAAHAFMLVSKSKGIAFQRRTSDGSLSAHTSGGSGTAPRWVRLARSGDVVTGYVSATGASWNRVGSATIDLPSTAVVGLAVSSHDAGRLATGAFEDVTITR